MPKAKQLTIRVEDRPGMLGEVASALGAEKVNILAFTAGVAEGSGVLHLVVDKPTAARKVFAECGWETSGEDVVRVNLADKPGSLGRVAKELGEAGVNIQYAYTGSAKSAGRVNTYFTVSDLEAALKALG